MLTDRTVLVTGGTGSLGQILVRRLLAGELGRVAAVVVMSRDEAKQHAMRLHHQHLAAATDEVIYGESEQRLRFQIGDVRDYPAFCAALRGVDVVFHTAALKQVPTCEYHPHEAVRTNVLGAENLVRAIRDLRLRVETVVGISTDKAVKPVNVMGMTKALQEKTLTRANLDGDTRFVISRYGNILASRGSVVPLFHEQIRRGGPVTLTVPEMTRFLMSLDDAVDTVFSTLKDALPGEIYVPTAPAARVVDVARALIGERDVAIEHVGIRPGEKVHETLVSEEEAARTVRRGGYLAIGSSLPELSGGAGGGVEEYRSSDDLLEPADVVELLRRARLMLEDEPVFA